MVRIIALLLLLPSLAFGAYSAPVGIPAPTWGIDDTMPSRPSPWTESTAGYYLVDKGSTYCTCSDSTNGNGYPGYPRCTIPTLTKGSYVEIYGPYDGGTIAATGGNKPNGNSWVANSDGPAWITCYDSNAYFTGESKVMIYGSYIYFDKINVKYTGSQSYKLSIGEGNDVDHLMIRNSSFLGSDAAGASNHAIVLSTWSSTAINDVIIYNNTITNYGDRVNTSADVDVHAVFIGPNDDTSEIYNVWVLGNTITEISGHTIFTGRQSGGDHTKTHHIYIGKNNISDSTVSGIYIKCINGVIVSENTIANIADPERWDDGKCIGMQYDPRNVWVINNKCSKATYGVMINGTDSTEGNIAEPSIYIVGNAIYDIGPTYRSSIHTGTFPNHKTTEDPAYGRPDAAISINTTGSVWIVNNTMTNSSVGIAVGESSSANIVAENNIISNINHAGGWAMWFLAPGAGYDITLNRNDIYPGATPTHKYRWDNNEYDTLAAFVTGSSGRCDNVDNDKDCIDTDPLLQSSTNLRLSGITSPAYNTGIASTSLTTDVYKLFNDTYSLAITTDIAGSSRPLATSWDIGAYEYDPTTTYGTHSFSGGAGHSFSGGSTITWGN